MMSNPLMLLRLEQVQKELEISPGQMEELTKLGEGLREEFQGMFSGIRDLPEEERRAKFEEMRGKIEKKVEEITAKANKILLPMQQERLQQIRVQMMGDRALGDDEIAKKLGLTEEQTKKLTAIGEEQQEARRKLFEGLRDVPAEERRERFGQLREQMEEITTKAQEKAKAVLTAKQIEILKKLKGEPFELDRRAMFGGRGGGGRRGGGGDPAP